MDNYILQIIGGIFYLLNKVFLSFSEHAKLRKKFGTARRWRILSWIVYLIGLPAWVFLFIFHHNWIAASVEASGIPAMLLGLVIAVQGSEQKPPKILDYLALVCIPIGFIYSVYDFGGFHEITQWLETILVVGFLAGTYLLAKERASGYLWYIIMHIACGWLMLRQGYDWLFLQQLISLLFIVDAYRTQKIQNDPAD